MELDCQYDYVNHIGSMDIERLLCGSINRFKSLEE
jgi:hypothetical protein